jgi:hypothetical protein
VHDRAYIMQDSIQSNVPKVSKESKVQNNSDIDRQITSVLQTCSHDGMKLGIECLCCVWDTHFASYEHLLTLCESTFWSVKKFLIKISSTHFMFIHNFSKKNCNSYKKTNFDVITQLCTGHFFLFYTRHINVVCANIECHDVHQKIYANFFWNF